MAAAIQVFGPAYMDINTGTQAAPDQTWHPIGFTRNGVEETDEAFWLDVPGDQYGGDDGPPIDVQFLGMVSRVRAELTKYDKTTAGMLRRRSDLIGQIHGNGLGHSACEVGGLMLGNDAAFLLRVYSACPIDPGVNDNYAGIMFHAAFPRAPIEINLATKFSTLVVEFECHRDQTSGYIFTEVEVAAP